MHSQTVEFHSLFSALRGSRKFVKYAQNIPILFSSAATLIGKTDFKIQNVFICEIACSTWIRTASTCHV